VKAKALQSGLARAAQADVAETLEPELNILGGLARCGKRLLAIGAAKGRLEQRQREADMQRGRIPEIHNDAQPPGACDAPKTPARKKPG
jgi:hypothetical protein